MKFHHWRKYQGLYLRWLERAGSIFLPPLMYYWARRFHPREPDLTALAPPVFVLSTGRCGTLTLAHLFKLAPDVRAFHEPLPDLCFLNNWLYQQPVDDSEIVFLALHFARGFLWDPLSLADKRYVETSNQTTFLAPWLHQLMPQARFLHLVRSPRPFARSATRRGWYTVPTATKRKISPRPGAPAAAGWDARDAFSKNVWYWNEVNRFACDFLNALPPGQGIRLHAEDIFSGQPKALRQLYALVDSEPPPLRRIQRVLASKHNQGQYSFLTRVQLDALNDAQQQILQLECGELAQKLGCDGLGPPEPSRPVVAPAASKSAGGGA